jgi:hypothetical protein
MGDVLAYTGAGLGVVLSLSVIAIIAFGKRVDRATDGIQELEFGGLRAKTNVVIMLLIVALVPVVLPIYIVLNRPVPVHNPNHLVFEKWTVRGDIDAQDSDESKVLVRPEHARAAINASGAFTAQIPVERTSDGRHIFPTLIFEHPRYRPENLDLQAVHDKSTFGNRNFNAVIRGTTIELGLPIQLVKRTAPGTPNGGQP